ncbi:maleylacetoacetate isomerase [Paracraurococcus lichenis]|uniref:Maleylacetoacetate isomerase n=1 Tax=Paracraurococcus lichenis TaxID=3064888 RepID=A0ABT9E531_9PROT|nr:maleylacetoacetate isomerase [Paracraurococcus sp. LOR1-02]MDO9711274.1 maleylacetoacetate isomerase [Paracraurococcus sp. LOR1-02]
MILWGYWRSTAAWRVRIALNLKGIAVEHRFRHLRRGEQRSAEALALNPQGLVPALVLGDGTVLTQSLAICEYLDETHPAPPLLPADPVLRARVRAFAQAIAAEVHAVQNLKILNRVKALGHTQETANAWAHDTIAEGLAACEALVRDRPGPFCFGDRPGLADIALVPQLYNARRFGVDLAGLPRLLAAEAACLALPAFAEAAAERQADAE